MSVFDLPNALTALATERPVFHSEADFQLALAWQLKHQEPSRHVRLEKRAPLLRDRLYVDLWAKEGQEVAAIELKYKTREATFAVGDEEFELFNQAAQDLARYDFLKDVVRLQEVVASGTATVGYAVFLTNDRSYWSPSSRSVLADELFRIHHGRELSGNLIWGATASPGTTKGREAALNIIGPHKLEWSPYSTLAGPRGEFRYLMVQVVPAQVASTEVGGAG
jgi:hypothetical protein